MTENVLCIKEFEIEVNSYRDCMKIKNSIVWMVTFVMLVALIIESKAAEYETMEDTKTYKYPVTAEDAKWNSFESVEEKIEACRIERDILKAMSNEQLVQAVLDFPFLYDVFVTSSFEEGVKVFEKISDAYAELLSRDSAKDAMYDMLLQMKEKSSIKLSAENEVKMDALAILLVFQKEFQNDMTEKELCEIAEISSLLQIAKTDDLQNLRYIEAVPTTPNGHSVVYTTPTCSHASSTYHAEIDANLVSTYGVTLISSGSCKYSCHSYAWHSQSTGNIYWIDNPSIYMTDGSYTRVVNGFSTSSLSAVPGDRVIYGSLYGPSHSAMITSSVTGAPLATRTVKSKWGKAGVFSHSVCNVPSVYDTSDVSAWHR